MSDGLLESARIALRECLNLGRNERLLVVCDPPCLEVGQALFQAGVKLAKDVVLVQITPRRDSGNEPPESVGKWFGEFQVSVMPTSKSLTHTQARRDACATGCRIATLPGITVEMFERTMKTNWDRLGKTTRTVAARLSAASTVTVRTERGTDFTFETGGRHAKADDGRLHIKGSYGNLPAGEAFLAPLEATARGRLVIDGSFPLAGLLNQPLIFEVKDGKVSDVSGHGCAEGVERLFQKYHAAARNIAEFGVGTLDTAVLTGHTLEDEKVKGTVHVAIGDNTSMGGTVHVPLHLDGVLREPSVWLDGQLWMDHGQFTA